MLMRLMSKGEYLIVPKGTKFTGSGKLGLNEFCLYITRVMSMLYATATNVGVTKLNWDLPTPFDMMYCKNTLYVIHLMIYHESSFGI